MWAFHGSNPMVVVPADAMEATTTMRVVARERTVGMERIIAKDVGRDNGGTLWVRPVCWGLSFLKRVWYNVVKP